MLWLCLLTDPFLKSRAAFAVAENPSARLPILSGTPVCTPVPAPRPIPPSQAGWNQLSVLPPHLRGLSPSAGSLLRSALEAFPQGARGTGLGWAHLHPPTKCLPGLETGLGNLPSHLLGKAGQCGP